MNNCSTGVSIRDRIQKFGRFLSGMVMPNIGAFIAWGLITALFIPTGWLPSVYLGKLVVPMITYLLPLLIGYTGGRIVAESRGGVVGAIATIGVIVGADIPMFIGAMIVGPLGGYVIKKFDQSVHGKIPAGFEMLVNNFSAGIIGAALALLAYTGIGPVVLAMNSLLCAGVTTIVNAGLLPLVSIFIEPGKIMFLNNAINHGVLSPIGIQQAKEAGKSIFFLLEPNPGPGLGILLAYWVFAKGMIRQSAPGAIIIQFFGGIHEIYFPYVLMNPMLFLAVILGGASGVAVFVMTGAGLVATPSPGSIFALLAMTPKGGYLPVLAGVTVSTVVSFLVASVFVKRSAGKITDDSLDAARIQVDAMKGSKSGKKVEKIIFACDAGMGSSAMGATVLANKVRKAGLAVKVTNCAIEAIPGDADIVITHEKLTGRARAKLSGCEHISVKDYINDPVFEELLEQLKATSAATTVELDTERGAPRAEIVPLGNIKIGLASCSREEAIKHAGQILVDSGCVEAQYIGAMLQREEDISTYIGRGIAIPHGTGEARSYIKKTGLSVLQYPEGVHFGDELVFLVIGIAGSGDEHMDILAKIATTIESGSDETMELLRTTTNAATIRKFFF